MNKSKRILSESLKDILSLSGIDSLTIKDIKSYILQMSWVDPGLKLYFMSFPYVMISSFQTLTQAKLFSHVPHWMVDSLLIIRRPHHFLADPIRFCTPLIPSSCCVVAALQLVWNKRKWSKGGGLAGGFILSLMLNWVTQPKRDQRECLIQTTSSESPTQTSFSAEMSIPQQYSTCAKCSVSCLTVMSQITGLKL